MGPQVWFLPSRSPFTVGISAESVGSVAFRLREMLDTENTMEYLPKLNVEFSFGLEFIFANAWGTDNFGFTKVF